MSTRRKKSEAELEQQLIADAADASAWGRPIAVRPRRSPRPDSYQREKETAVCDEPIPHLIGRVAITFAVLELHLEEAIWQMVAEDDETKRKLGEAITAEMSFDRKVHAFYSMFALQFPSEADDPVLKQLIKDLSAAQEKRNQILHSARAFSADGSLVQLKRSAKKTTEVRRTPARVEPILSVQRELVGLVERFGRFAREKIQHRKVLAKKAG